MKTTNRLVALLLALVMIISCAPLSIFAEDTATEGTPDPVRPVADAYLSAQYPDTPTGELNFLRVNGGKNENIILLSFETAAFGDKTVQTLSLPATNEAHVVVDVYLVDGGFEEMTVTYNNYNVENTLAEAELLVDNAVLAQNGGILFPFGTKNEKLSGMGEYFTLVIRADAEAEADVWNYESMLNEFLSADKTSAGRVTITFPTNQKPAGEEGFVYAYAHTYDEDTNADMTYTTGQTVRFFGNAGSTTAGGDRIKNASNYLEAYASVTNMRHLLIYNALSDAPMYIDEGGKVMSDGRDMTGKTYRFKAHAYPNTNASRNFSVGVAPSYSLTYSEEYAETTPVASDASGQSRQDLFIDYTVDPDHIGAPQTVDGTTYYTYPAFFVKSSASGHLGEHSVVELDANGFERQAVVMAGSVSSDRIVIGEPASCEFLPGDPTVLLADTYVSAKYPDTVFGFSDKLLLNGGEENVILVTYQKSLLDIEDDIFFALPATSDVYVDAQVLLLDGYCVNESTLTYNKYKAMLAESEPITLYSSTILSGNAPMIDLSPAKELDLKGDCFTLVIRTDTHYYFEDFDECTTTGAFKRETNEEDISDNADGTKMRRYGFSNTDTKKNPQLVTSGTLGEFQLLTVANETNENNRALRYLWYNKEGNSGRWGILDTVSFYEQNSNETDAVLANGVNIHGKKYRITMDFKSAGTSTTDPIDLNGKVHLVARPVHEGGKAFASTTINESTLDWIEVSLDYTVNAEDLPFAYTNNGVNYLSDAVFGFTHVSAASFGATDENPSYFYAYFIDNVRVVEVTKDGIEHTPLETNGSAYIVCVPQIADGETLLADTYVSAQYPDMAFGNSDRLLLNGGKNENIIFLTYSAQVLNSNTPKFELNLPVENDAYVNAEIFLLDGCYLDENNLTWNTMPALDDANSVGTCLLTGGVNKIDVSVLKDKVIGEFFTVAIKSLDDPSYVWNQGFDLYDSDTSFTISSENRYEVTDENDKTWSYQFNGSGDINKFALNGGRIITSAYVRNVDGNKVFETGMSSTAGGNSGRNKFMDSFFDTVITKSDDNAVIETNGYNITGKTYRFKALVKLANEDSEGLTVRAQVTSPRLASAHSGYNGTQKTLNNNWQEVYFDYTVNADHIAKLESNVYTFPMFALEFAGKSNDKAYVDNLNTVELVEVDGEWREMQAVITSAEAEGKIEIVGKGVAPIADTYVSAENPDTPYGSAETLLFNGGFYENAIFLSYSASGFTADDILKLTLPIAVDRATPIEIFLLDGVEVDEEADTYNTLIPQLATAVSLGTYNLEGDASELELGKIKEFITSDVFTIAVRSTKTHEKSIVYSEDFEGFEANPDYNIGTDTEHKIRNIVTLDDGSLHRVAYDLNNHFSYDSAGGNPPATNRFLVDPLNEENTVFSFKTNGNAVTVTFNNLISNAPIEKIGDQVWTNGENITGYTYRFYADIMVTASGNRSGNLVVRNLDADSTIHINSTPFTIIKAEWTTFSHDYTINADDFSVNVGKDAYTYADPAFGFYATAATRTYCFDNFKVIVIVDPVEVASSGIVLGKADNAIVDNAVAIEAEVSSASNGDIIVIGGETVLTVADGKLYYGETLLGNAKGEAFELTETPETITAVYDDVTGRIRFAFRGGFACDETGAIIYAKVFNYGVSEDATVNEGVNFSIIKRTPEIVGYQTKDTQYAVRFIAGVDSLYYSNIGFEVNTVGGSMKEVANPGVCSSVNADDVKANATDYGYNYMSLLSIVEIADSTSDAEVVVRPYFLIGNAKIYGEAVTYTISIVDNAVVVE